MISALKSDCHSKCMYCEGRIDDVAYSAVEHIAPKERFPDLILEWENLGLACTRCNTNKGAYWTEDPSLKILNPYSDEVGEHLSFAGPMLVPAAGSKRGANTIRKLKFNERTDLLISKFSAIQELHDRIERWASETNVELRELYEEDLRDALNPSREFAATLIAHARANGYPVTDSPRSTSPH
ncbi:HNH endonuclease [Microbacterium sp. che218]|uniref:HNH endonuclease n=1 Tax=Microbacterium sp. che218 TaxID=3140649 RepID=UPI00336BCB27